MQYKSPENFSVIVVADRVTTYRPHEKEKDINQYVMMPNRTRYKLRLENSTNMKTDALILLDGERIGVWRIDPNSTIFIDRPANNNKKFIFVKELHPDLKLNPHKESMYTGLLKVIFYPERPTTTKWISPMTCAEFRYNNPHIRNPDCLLAQHNIPNMISHNYVNYNNANPQYSTPQQEINEKVSKQTNQLVNIKKDLATTITIKFLVDTSFEKPFISTQEADIRKRNDFELKEKDIKMIPKVRIYEDFFFFNRILPYDQY